MAINLIPQEEAGEQKDTYIGLGLILGIITVLFVGGIFGVKFFLLEQDKAGLQARENDLSSQEANLSVFKNALEEYKKNPALLLSIQSRNYYSQFFDKLNDAIPPNARIATIAITSDSTVSLSGDVVGKYADVSRLMKLLKENGFSNIKLSTVSRSGDSIGFSLQFNFTKYMIQAK